MKNIVNRLCKLFLRWSYPVSIPEDVIGALGIEASSSLNFSDFIHLLSSQRCMPKNLFRYMPRSEAEALFISAVKKERFRYESMYSYYFSDSWMEFVLHFDQQSRLRRVYLQHRDLKQEEGIEILLPRQVWAKDGA